MSKKNSPAASADHAELLQPMFDENQVNGDPRKFRVNHPSDNPLYELVNKKLLQPIPKPIDPHNMILSLEKVWGKKGRKKIRDIKAANKIVFHAMGDTGMTQFSLNSEMKVADKMVNDFSDEHATDIPSFFFHLGDVVYSFGEGRYYYDQFYEPYKDYPAPILAIPGNHDGVVYEGDKAKSLEAFKRNFVNKEPKHCHDAVSLVRTAMIQPGVYFTLDAPFVTIIGLYSNVLEDPGVISSQGEHDSVVDDQQLHFLTDQLKLAKGNGKAVIVAVHHPPFTAGKTHGGSPNMLKDLDNCCSEAQFWPHAFLSGHAHNYQRFTRTVKSFDHPSDKYDVPYIVCGNGGHHLTSLTKKNNAPLRTPQKYSEQLLFENYDDRSFGYLRVICDATSLRIEYHDCDLNQKSESDAVTIDLQKHEMISN